MKNRALLIGPPIVLCAVLITFFVLDARVKPLLIDEFLTYRLSAAKTLREFTAEYWGHESNPPFYYILNNIIFRAVNATGVARTEFSLRFQSLLWALAFVALVWHAGKRELGSGAAWFAVVTVTISSSLIYFVTEARPYTMLCFAVALALVVSAQSATANITRWRRVSIFATFALLANSHTFGVLYGFLIAGGVAIFSLIQGRHWKSQAAASAGGLATFALSVPMIFPSALMMRSWVPIPSPMTGYRQFAMQIDYQPYLICIILAFAVATLRSLAGCKARNVVQQIPQPRLVAMTVASCACILIIPMVFIESYIFRPMFWPKYFLGLSIAYFILFGLMTKAVLNALGVQDWQKWVRLSLYGLLIVLAATPPLGARRLYARGPTAAELLSVNHPAAFVKQSLIEPQLLAGVPVVFQDDLVAELFKHYATVSGLNVRFLEVLNERDSVVIYRKVVANFGREAGQRILIFSNPTVPLDEIACGSSARLTKIGNAELPYMGFIAPVYLLQMAGY